jgi:RNA polymerase sigma-70 factor (ECF subfamily)
MTTPHPPDVASIAVDPDAFEAFYREHLDSVRRYVARRVRDPHLAADLTAEIFLAAIDSAATYRPERGAPGAWLVGVAKNVIATEFRRQSRDRGLVRRIAGRRLLDPDSLARLEEQLDAERDARRVLEAIASLPRRERALMELVAVDGLSVTDAAAVLGVKPGTARVRLHRGRARLNAHINPSIQEVTS